MMQILNCLSGPSTLLGCLPARPDWSQQLKYGSLYTPKCSLAEHQVFLGVWFRIRIRA